MRQLLLARMTLQALLDRKENCKALLPWCQQQAQMHKLTRQSKTGQFLGVPGELDKLFPMVSIFQTPASARAFNPWEDLMHIRRDE